MGSIDQPLAQHFIIKVQKRAIEVDKLVQPLQWSSSGKCYSTERIKLFEDELEKFCSTNKAPLADLWTPLSKTINLESLLPDGVHPNNKGHELIASLVLPELEKLLN